MNKATLLKIADDINNISYMERILVNVDFNPFVLPDELRKCEAWDIIISYNGYKTVDRFNSSMPIKLEDSGKIAVSLLRNLFTDYFESKLKQNKGPN